jgi:hypothetical protein
MEELDSLKHGALPLVCLILFILVDKILVPLISDWKNNGWGNGTNGSRRHGNSTPTLDYRIARTEQDIHELRVAIEETRKTTDAEVRDIRVCAQVSQAILARLEKRLDEL